MTVAVAVIFIMQPDLKLDSSWHITRSLDRLPNPYVVRMRVGASCAGQDTAVTVHHSLA